MNLPVYNNFFKFFIVEELALERNIEKIHYGKCSVIGYLSSSDCLQSLNISCMDEQYQLPDCKISLKLFNDLHEIQYISSTVQVLGELRLYNPALDLNYSNLESSYSLIHRLNQLPVMDLEHAIDAIKSKYVPIIQVHKIRHVQDAKEIILENLNYRLLQRKKDEFYYKN